MTRFSFIFKKNFWMFMLFLLLSTILWLLTTLNGDYETEIEVPLKMKRQSDEVMLVQPPVDNLKVLVKDKGLMLLNYVGLNSYLPLTFDMREAVHERGGRGYYLASKLAKQMQGQLNSSTQILSITPDTIEFYYTTGEAHRLPVTLEAEITAAPQYHIDSITLSPDSVTVVAPAEVADTLVVRARPAVPLVGLKDSLSLAIPLSPPKGVVYQPRQVTLAVKVLPLIQKSFDLPVREQHFPAGCSLRTFPSKVKVVFNVDIAHYNSVEPQDFEVAVDYRDLAPENSDNLAPVKLVKSPQCASAVRIEPATLEYLIEKLPENED